MNPPLLLPALLLVLGVLLVGRVLYDRLPDKPTRPEVYDDFTRAMREDEERQAA